MMWKRYSRYIAALTLCLRLFQPASATTPGPGGDFTLTDHNGGSWSLQEARGKVVLLIFGYTSCPDVCPTSLLTLQKIMRRLGKRAAEVQPLFVSVDPERDTPEILKRYVAYFDPSIIALTGPRDILDNITRRYRTSYRYTGSTDSSGYLVDHSSSLYVIDASGQLVSIVPYGTPDDIIFNSILKLLPPQK